MLSKEEAAMRLLDEALRLWNGKHAGDNRTGCGKEGSGL